MLSRETISCGGYRWTYFPAAASSTHAILLVGQSRGVLIRACAGYFHALGCAFLAIPPAQNGQAGPGLHSFPLECVEAALDWLRERGVRSFGVMGASATGMLALTIAAQLPVFSLVLAYTPSDFVMQGYYNGKKSGGISEWPAPNESTLSRNGQPVPYAPFHLSPEEYHALCYGKATKDAGELTGLPLFAHVEALGIPENARIPVENIAGKLMLFGAEDDTLWPTARYIRQMRARLDAHGCKNYEAHSFRYGTHLIFPEGIVRRILPFGISFLLGRFFRSAKAHPDECRQTRLEIDRLTARAVQEWRAQDHDVFEERRNR